MLFFHPARTSLLHRTLLCRALLRGTLLFRALACCALLCVGPSTPAQLTAPQIRAYEAIVRLGLHGNGTKAEMPGPDAAMTAYIHACGALGDHYAKLHTEGRLPSLKPAMRYYDKVVYLRAGTDGSDIGDGHAGTERNRVARRVAALYKELGVDPRKNNSLYVGYFLDMEGVDLRDTFRGSLAAGDTAAVHYLLGSAGLTADAQRILQGVAAEVKRYPGRRVVVQGESPCDTYEMQQLGWARTNVVAEYLRERCGLPEAQIIFQYCPVYTGRDQARIYFAPPGTEGPSRAAPPGPGWFSTD